MAENSWHTNQELNWQRVLNIVLSYIYEPCQKSGKDFIITGSTASALQKCPINPANIDILVKNPENVNFIADLMQNFELQTTNSLDSNVWLSSKQNRVFIFDNKERDELWHMGRWFVENMQIEVAFIQSQTMLDKSQEDGYIWENGPEMYDYTKQISFSNYIVQVVPLEIQLSSLFLRGKMDRIQKIAEIFASEGYDRYLLNSALKLTDFQIITQLIQNLREENQI